MENDIDFMRRAVEQARKGDLKPGANAIGCVIVRDGEILAEGSTRSICATIRPRMPRSSPSAGPARGSAL